MEIETPLLSVNCAASNEIFYQSSIVEQCSSLKKEESNGVYFVWTLDSGWVKWSSCLLYGNNTRVRF